MEVYPRTEILFYSSLGPYLEVVPYLSEKMDYSITGNYNYGLYSGLDARIGSTGAVLGMKIPDFGPVEFNIKKDTIYQEPSKLNIVSGDKQEGTAGKALGKPIVLKALDSDKQPVVELPIHFSTNSGSVDKTSQKTNKDGEASVVWTLGDSEGEQKLEAWLEDGNDQKIKSTVTTLTAKSMIKLPTVETYGASNVSETSALSGGNVTDDGGANVTARGVCWNTTGNPSIANSKTENGEGEGTFSSGMSGLIANTTYYVRAYAKNIKGTGYGSQVSFTTTSLLLTANVTNITSTTATCGGTVTSENGLAIIARGICWNTTGNPTIADNKTNDGSGLGSFTSSLNGLTANTTYYLRVFATSSSGTAYGKVISFMTSNENENGIFSDRRDGRNYKWVKIGTQTWMSENLAYLPYVTSSDEESLIAPCYYNELKVCSSVSDHNYRHLPTYGVLYNWTAALSACPDGWHLPSKSEWEILTKFVTDSGIWGNFGNKMKSVTGWKSAGANNTSGFSALPGMYFLRYLVFLDEQLGTESWWWSSSEHETLAGYPYVFGLIDTSNGSSYTYRPVKYGLSVRCVKD